MHTAFIFFIVLITLVQRMFASSCHESFEKLTTSRDPYWHYRYHYRPPERIIVVSSNLTCFNVSSIMDLNLPPTYNHTKQEYKQYLEIRNSSVVTLPKGAFSKFQYMEKLYLSGIHLRNIESGAFEGLKELHILYLNDNDLTELTYDMFSSLPELFFLELSRNKIRQIESNAFANVGRGLHYLELHLEYNSITTFADDLFENVTDLDLSGNPLKKIPTLDAEILRLSNVSLTKFDVDMSNVSSLTSLDLSSNQLNTFNCSLIPVTVRNLDLSNNAIVSVNVEDLHEVQALNLSNNQIKSFKAVSKISRRSGKFDLSYNKIEILEDLVFNTSKFSHISQLDLSHNEISIINKNAFSGLLISYSLLLSFNRITEIPTGLFTKMDLLTILDLSSNEIESFQFGTFEGLSSLRVLNLSNNNLIELNPHTLHPMSVLRTLYFKNNKISSLDPENFATYFPEIREIHLDHNRWNCEDLVNIRQTFLKHGKIISSGDSFDVENHYGIACTARDKFYETGGNSSGFSVNNFYNYIKNSIDDDVLKSKMNRFFNGDFKNTKYFQSVNQTVSVKLDSPNSKPLGALTITQILIFTLIFLLGCLLYVNLRRLRSSYRAKLASRLELVGTEE